MPATKALQPQGARRAGGRAVNRISQQQLKQNSFVAFWHISGFNGNNGSIDGSRPGRGRKMVLEDKIENDMTMIIPFWIYERI